MISGLYSKLETVARQSRSIVSYQPLNSICVQVGGHYLLLAYAIHVWQIYGITAIESGHVPVWKAIMTVEAAGLK